MLEPETDRKTEVVTDQLLQIEYKHLRGKMICCCFVRRNIFWDLLPGTSPCFHWQDVRKLFIIPEGRMLEGGELTIFKVFPEHSVFCLLSRLSTLPKPNQPMEGKYPTPYTSSHLPTQICIKLKAYLLLPLLTYYIMSSFQ